jgi:pimeloyl-ACP methyl ester carboxylesterase
VSALGKVVGSVSVAGGLIGAAALGGVTAQRRGLRRYRLIAGDGDGSADSAFDALEADRSYSVAAADGVALHVEEAGPADAPLTVVFSHGWTLRSGSWHFQRLGLAGPDFGSGAESDAESGSGDAPPVRMVFYDQRSHGRSSKAEPGHATIDDLAADLAAVIATAAPSGPLVLVGHSMGGMALLALAGRDPGFFADRVAGVALLSTTASEVGHRDGRWLQINGANPLLPVFAAAAARYPRMFERGRTAGRDAIWLLTRSLGFADPKVPAALVDYLDQMISATPMDVIAEFAPALFGHDETAAAPALTDIPALIAVGDADRMTPPSRSRDIADMLPRAELLVIQGAGHMAIMEAPEAVNDALRRLLRAAWRRIQSPAASTAGGGSR